MIAYDKLKADYAEARRALLTSTKLSQVNDALMQMRVIYSVAFDQVVEELIDTMADHEKGAVIADRKVVLILGCTPQEHEPRIKAWLDQGLIEDDTAELLPF